MIKIIAYNTVLGINGKIFSLTKGEEIQTFEINKYLRVRTIIQGQETYLYQSTIKRIT